MRKITLILCLILLALAATPAKASHVMGADLAYECLGNGKYRIIVNLYRDCNGVVLNNTIDYRYRCSNSSVNTLVSANRTRVVDVTGISAACGVISKCSTGSNFSYGMEQHVYIDTLDFSGLNCCEVKVYYDVCCRNSGINTGPANQNFYTEMVINKCVSSCNSSPKYTNYPVAIVCKDQDVVLNSGAVDTIDVGDSLSYELTPPLSSPTTNVTYSGSFTSNRPLSFLGFPNFSAALPSGFHLNPTTGDLAFQPTQLNQMTVLAIKVKEWRKDGNGVWQQIGESRRDLQVIVISCVNSSGVANSLPSLDPLPTARVCSGDSVCMRIVAGDANSGDTVRLTWNSGIPGASFSIANPGGRLDTAWLCWKPRVQDTSSVPYTFTVTARDNACPFPGFSTRAYSVQVGLKPETNMQYIVDTCGLIQMKSTPLSVYADPVFTWALMDAQHDTIFKSVSQNVNNTYAFLDPGKYFVYHKIETGFPCYSDFYDSFEVASYPVIRSSLPNDTVVCKNSEIHLNSAVNGGVAPFRYSWNTSVSDTASQLNIRVDRDTVLVVTVSDRFGCFHRDTVSAETWVLPESRIKVDKADQCFTGNFFSFQDSSVISVGSLTRIWDFGNGDTSSLPNPTSLYTFADTFRVSLISRSDNACLDTAYEYIRVHPQAVPRIRYNDSAQCLQANAFVFDGGNSTIPYESIREWYWNFGDTTVDTGLTVHKTYARFGFMNVRLITETESGCRDTAWQTVRVNPNPKARININDSLTCLRNNQIKPEATLSSIADGYISAVNWLFGDAGADTGWNPAAHQYMVSDTFRIRMTVLSDQLCGDTSWQKVVIHPQTQVGLQVDSTDACLRGNRFYFDATGSVLSSGSIQQYAWDYQDGQTGLGARVNHTFTAPDTFRVRLVTTTALLCRDTAWQQVIIHPQAVPDFVSNADSQCLNLNSFSFDASPLTIDWGTVDSLYWDFDNGQTDTGWTIPSVIYSNAGTYVVRLATVSDYGCRDTVEQIRQVHPRAIPQIQTNYTAHCLSFNAFVFDGSASRIPSGTINQYQWNLEDGAVLNGIRPAAYTFSSADSFDVQLITTSNYGCQDTANTEVVVHPLPVPDIGFNTDQQCFSGNDFRFDATGSSIPSGSIVKYNWDYGDGNSGNTALTPNKVYAAHGNYTLKLRLESALGCADSGTHLILVHPQMRPAIQIVDSFVCVKGNFFDLNASSSSIPYGSIQQYLWNFGDGSTQSGVNIGIKNFNYYDTFDIRLKTISDRACADSIYRRIVVYPQPTASFVVNDSIQCFDRNHSFSFDATGSSVPSPWAGITSLEWSSGDGAVANGQFWLNKSFASRGLYNIQLRVTSRDGCRDTMNRQVWFYPAMATRFSTPDTAQCFNEHAFVFNAGGSSIPLGSIQRYTWKYEDNTVALGVQPPAKRFGSFDTFTVWLITTSNENCEDSISREMIVFESPRADFEVQETCLRQASLFTDKSQIGHDTFISWAWDFGDQRTSNDQNPAHYYRAADDYDVKLRVESNNHCFHDTLIPAVALVKELPEADFTYEAIDYDFEYVKFQYSDNSKNPVSWAWDFGDGQTSQIPNPVISYSDTLHYEVRLIVSNSLNCQDTSIQTVWAIPEFEVYVPNAFTPNGDDYNPGFGPRATVYYLRYRMKIYDRWGALMFETNDLSKTWDGTYLGKACDSGMYVYHIHLVDLKGKTYNLKGSVTLTR